ncbi:MAG: hypothetical protein RL616_313 [Verrucomicrobiota bacterium]
MVGVRPTTFFTGCCIGSIGTFIVAKLVLANRAVNVCFHFTALISGAIP